MNVGESQPFRNCIPCSRSILVTASRRKCGEQCKDCCCFFE